MVSHMAVDAVFDILHALCAKQTPPEAIKVLFIHISVFIINYC